RLVNEWKSVAEGESVISAMETGGTKTAVGTGDDAEKVSSKMESATTARGEKGNGLQRISAMLRETAREAGVEIGGIGIASTGIVYPFSGAFGDVDFLPDWQGNNPVEDLAREFSVTTALENDADASALGEAGWGA